MVTFRMPASASCTSISPPYPAPDVVPAMCSLRRAPLTLVLLWWMKAVLLPLDDVHGLLRHVPRHGEHCTVV